VNNSRSKATLLMMVITVSACDTSPVPVLSPWPFRADQVRISCEWDYVGSTRGPERVYVIDDKGTRYAANDAARATAPDMLPLLDTPDQGQVERAGLRLCDLNMERSSTSFRRPSGALIYTR